MKKMIFIILLLYNSLIANILKEPDFVLTENQCSKYYGRSISTGDINGDGYTDVIIGDDKWEGQGAVFVYYGSKNGFSTNADWIGMCNQKKSYYGGKVSTAGDINGDGYDDVIIGAPGYNKDNSYGAIFVYYGSKNGLSKKYNYIIKNDKKGLKFGLNLSTAGDVNGDRYDDIIIGVYYSKKYKNRGAVIVYYGSKIGLDTNYVWIEEGSDSGEMFGYDVSTAGDVNGDGYDDVIIGAVYKNINSKYEGAAFVYYGSKDGLSKHYNWLGSGEIFHSKYGNSVSTAGDINGDGYDDILVSAKDYNSMILDPYNKNKAYGAVYVYYGSKNGLAKDYDWMQTCNKKNAYYGSSVSTAEDINGDGYDDILVSAENYRVILPDSFNQNKANGVVFIYYGSKNGLSKDVDMIKGKKNFGMDISAIGDVNGDGYDDIMISSYKKVYIYYGSANFFRY